MCRKKYRFGENKKIEKSARKPEIAGIYRFMKEYKRYDKNSFRLHGRLNGKYS
jgi:hypothetical protein